MGNLTSGSAPVPADKWKKWVKNLKDDHANSDYLNFDNIPVPREFYANLFKNTEFYPYVYYGLTDDGIFCLIIVQAEFKNGKVKVKSDNYYVFEANKPYYKVDKNTRNRLCKNWKDVAKSHNIKLKAFTIPKENFTNIISDTSVTDLFFFIGEDTEETSEYYKIKPLMSGQQLTESTILGDGDPDDPDPIYNNTYPCPPFCDKEPGSGG